MIEFANVCKVYESSTPVKVEALKNVSLKIEDGEFVYVIGPNGSGKSTLVKLLTAEERLTSGSLTFGDYQLGRIRRRKVPYLRRKIGMVYQDFRLIDTMTVYQNVAFALHVTDTPVREIRRRVPKILDIMGLTSKAKSYPNELSGGEQQRVGIARALVGNPQLLIADEPTGNIDPEMSCEILQLLGEINAMGTTVIFVTHQREFLRMMPHRVIMLEQGRVIFDEDLAKASQAAKEIETLENEESSEIDEDQLPIAQYIDENTREFEKPTEYEDGFVPSEH